MLEHHLNSHISGAHVLTPFFFHLSVLKLGPIKQEYASVVSPLVLYPCSPCRFTVGVRGINLGVYLQSYVQMGIHMRTLVGINRYNDISPGPTGVVFVFSSTERFSRSRNSRITPAKTSF